MRKNLNIAMIGTGFMGRMHSNAYRQANSFFDSGHAACMKVVCARDPGRAKEFAERWSWQETETDWRRLVDRKDIDLIDICVPNSLHRDIAVAALAAGKMVATEKPLALNAEQGREMVDAAAKSGKKTMVWFNQRRFPPVTLARQMIDAGAIGRVFHYRAMYLQDWTISADAPLGGSTFWRLDAKEAGSGVTGDLLAHTLDIAMWLNGPIVELSALTETFIKERKRQGDPATTAKVEIDDASECMARFANGSIGTFEATRYARGRKNANMLRDQRGAGVTLLRRGNPARAAVLQPQGRQQGPRVEDDIGLGFQPALHGPLVGARDGHGLRAHLRARGRGFPRGPRRRQDEGPRFRGRPSHPDRVRHDPRLGEEAAVDGDWPAVVSGIDRHGLRERMELKVVLSRLLLEDDQEPRGAGLDEGTGSSATPRFPG